MVQEAESRKQAAVANRFLNGYVLEGSLSAPLPTLADAEQIHVYLLHGGTMDPATDEKKFFMHLAVPDSEVVKYCWDCSLQQLKQDFIADRRAKIVDSSPVTDSCTSQDQEKEERWRGR